MGLYVVSFQTVSFTHNRVARLEFRSAALRSLFRRRIKTVAARPIGPVRRRSVYRSLPNGRRSVS